MVFLYLPEDGDLRDSKTANQYMKRLMLVMSMAICLSFSTKDVFITDEERQFAADYMKLTRDALVKDVSGLSDAQLIFQASPEKWSVALCLEHIALAETALMNYIQNGLKQPSDSSGRSAITASDTTVLRVVTDRSHKSTAPEILKPEGKFPTSEEALRSFIAKRNQNIEYVMTTHDDLRNHYLNHAIMGKIDDYQGILLIAAHCRRHTLQIEEVMANPNFPKK